MCAFTRRHTCSEKLENEQKCGKQGSGQDIVRGIRASKEGYRVEHTELGGHKLGEQRRDAKERKER
jgi:hypothetical protein